MISSAPSDPGVTRPPQSFCKGIVLTAIPVSSEFSCKVNQVPRTHHVSFIGDSHGNHEGFRKNMEALGYNDDGRLVVPEDHKLVMLGDIVADRHTSGIPILLDIADIRARGGKIDIIAGNHEDLLLSFLFQRLHMNCFDVIETCKIKNAGIGLTEFARFQTQDTSPYSLDTLCPSAILSGMQLTTEGRIILETLCSMKVGTQIDDTLFVHTDMTDAMAAMILQYGLDAINEIFQRNLRSFLLKGIIEPDAEMFHTIRDVFLSTNNRRENIVNTHTISDRYTIACEGLLVPSFSDTFAEKINDTHGINRIIHGHTDHSKYDTTGRLIEDMRTIVVGSEGILVTSVDYSAFKRKEREHGRSIGRIVANKGTFYTYNH